SKKKSNYWRAWNSSAQNSSNSKKVSTSKKTNLGVSPSLRCTARRGQALGTRFPAAPFRGAARRAQTNASILHARTVINSKFRLNKRKQTSSKQAAKSIIFNSKTLDSKLATLNSQIQVYPRFFTWML